MYLSDRVMDLQNESVVDFFFTPLGGDMFKCTCNKRVKQPGKKGYTNLMSHLKNVHKDSWENEYRKSKTKQQAVLPYPKVNEKVENNFRWLEWVIFENREYSFVDKPLVRKNTKLEPICQKTAEIYRPGFLGSRKDIRCVCTLALTVAKTSSHYDRFAISVPVRSLLLFDLA